MLSFNLHKTLKAADGEMNLEIQEEIPAGQLLALYGPSGIGKTSILRMLAGLMRPDKGSIKVGNEIWLDSAHKIFVPPQERNIGFLFQNYTLFPNMTVRENLNFALQKGQSSSIIDELIEITELQALQDRRATALSGGQQQRAALARAIVRRPKLLLLDEPLSALDDTMRATLQSYILKIHEQYNLTTILVSHNTAEVVKLADRVLIIEKGKVKEDGKTSDIFKQNGILGKIISINHKAVEIQLEDGQSLKIPFSALPKKEWKIGEEVRFKI